MLSNLIGKLQNTGKAAYIQCVIFSLDRVSCMAYKLLNLLKLEVTREVQKYTLCKSKKYQIVI